MKRKFRTFILLTALMLATASAWCANYIVQSGDTLSGIARRHIPGRVYGKQGSLDKLLSVNPQIKNPNLIYVGQNLSIDGVSAPLAARPKRAPAAEAPAVVEDVGTPLTISEKKPAKMETMAPAPTPSPNASPESNYPLSHLGADLGSQYFKIVAHDPVNGGNATLLSNLSPQLRLGWDLDWNEAWTTRLRFSLVSESMINATSTTSTITGGDAKTYAFELGAIRNWGESQRTGFAIGSVARGFARSTSATTVTVDRVQELKFRLNHEFDLFQVKGARFGLGLGAALLSGGTGSGYTTSFGWDGDASLYLRHAPKNSSLEIRGEAYFTYGQQNSTIVEQKDQHIGVFLGLAWKLGE